MASWCLRDQNIFWELGEREATACRQCPGRNFGQWWRWLSSRPAQFFLGFPPQTPRWSLGQNLPGDQFSANSEVVWLRHGGSEGPQVEVVWALPGDLRSLRDVVKQLLNWLKIGLQAGFGPNFTVEFEAEIPKKFGLAYCIYALCNILYSILYWIPIYNTVQ